MDYPKISVIIPTYNRSYFLNNALQSVIDQRYPNLEVLVIDGNSTDNTYEVVKAFASLHPCIQYIKNTHKHGAPGAKNTGLDVLSGDFFATLDDDDVLLRGALQKLVNAYMEKEEQYGIILGNRLRSDDQTFSGLGIEESREVHADEFWYGVLSGKFFGIIKSDLIGDDRFDEDLKGGDRLFWNKLYTKTRIYYLHQPMRIYNIHSESLTASLRHQPLIEARAYEKEISFLEKQDTHPQKSNYLATLHNKIAKLYLEGNEKFKAREHIKKSLSCKIKLEAFSTLFHSYV